METKIARMAELPRLYDGAAAQLAKAVGVRQFGCNHIILMPGAFSSRRHWHEEEDEFVLVLEGAPTLIDEHGARTLAPGDCIGFPAGVANGHHITNRSAAPAVILVVGTRKVGQERVHYPDEGAAYTVTRDADGNRVSPS